ncbi:PEP-utilizing enzyme [Mycobacterium lepromatosis]|uniref:PEP-utilizing enzyme n=1 Tax=Mycobacterium lepromatosis TaxID=480418 RepID=UPI000AF9F115
MTRLLAEPGEHLNKLAIEAPEFHATVRAELALTEHRGPAEVEMLSSSYADNPELLVRMITKALSALLAPPAPASADSTVGHACCAVSCPPTARPRSSPDRVVRAIGVLRGLLREYGRRLTDAGVFDTADDVFYLLVDELDELDRLPVDVSGLIARRRVEHHRLAAIVPPTVFSGSWQPLTTSSSALGAGDILRGVGVSSGRACGRVLILRPEIIDDLQPGEILVAEVTDVGLYFGLLLRRDVVTELGNPMSHAAVVAREFGFPCVADAQGATRCLPPGALVEVDGNVGGKSTY